MASLFDRLKTLGDTARDVGRTAGRAVYDYVREQPEVQRRVDKAKVYINEARSTMEERADGIERDLWEWIREMQAQGYRARQQVDRARTADHYYRVLGVRPGADMETIKSAWRQKMKENHPDRFGDDPAAEAAAQHKAQAINEAYRELRILLTGR